MSAIIAFLVAHKVLIVGALVAVLQLAAALSKKQKVKGILGTIIALVQRGGILQPKDSAGTVKLPGAKPSEPPIMGG